MLDRTRVIDYWKSMDRPKEVSSPSFPETSPDLVDGELLCYLTASELFGLRRLPDALDLAWAAQYMETMLNEQRLVFVHSEAEQDVLKADLEDDEQFGAFVSNDSERMLLLARMMVREPAERERTVYYDPHRSPPVISCTSVYHGSYRQVESSIFSDVLSQEMIPLLQIHTHPESRPFSPEDYLPLLTSLASYTATEVSRKRVLYGSIILNPDIQMFAATTERTPLLHAEDAKVRIANKKDQLSSEYLAELAPFREKELIAYDLADEVIMKSKTQFFEMLAELQQEIQRGTVTEAEVHLRLDAFLMDAGPEGRKATEVFQEVSAQRRRAWNRQLIRFARDVHIDLYSSTNMRDFTIFSA